MKKIILNSAALVLVIILSFSVFTPKSAAYGVTAQPDIQNADVSKVIESRFLNMLNHNFVYNESFSSSEEMVNSSIVALLSLRDSVDDSYISEIYVKDYIYNMYGIRMDDFSKINVDYPSRKGYIYIVPRGFTVYTHKINSVTANEDGSYTVITDVTVSAHDNIPYTCKAETLFSVNEDSQFGFNILYCDILDETNAV